MRDYRYDIIDCFYLGKKCPSLFPLNSNITMAVEDGVYERQVYVLCDVGHYAWQGDTILETSSYTTACLETGDWNYNKNCESR